MTYNPALGNHGVLAGLAHDWRVDDGAWREGPVYVFDGTLAGYSPASDPVTDTPITGSVITLTLPWRMLCLLRCCGLMIKSGGGNRLSVYDNGVKIDPSATIPNWTTFTPTGSASTNQKQFDFETPLLLEAGRHVLQIEENAFANTNAPSYANRVLIVRTFYPV